LVDGQFFDASSIRGGDFEDQKTKAMLIQNHLPLVSVAQLRRSNIEHFRGRGPEDLEQ